MEKELLEALTDLLNILDEMGLSTMPGDTNADLREACEDAKRLTRYARLFAGAPKLLDAVNHVLIASEDGGGMNDIDWDFLRSAVKEATEVSG